MQFMRAFQIQLLPITEIRRCGGKCQFDLVNSHEKKGPGIWRSFQSMSRTVAFLWICQDIFPDGGFPGGEVSLGQSPRASLFVLPQTYTLGGRLAVASGAFVGVVGFIPQAAIAFVVWYGGTLVIEGSITIGLLTSFLLYTVTVATVCCTLLVAFENVSIRSNTNNFRLFSLHSCRFSWIPKQSFGFPKKVLTGFWKSGNCPLPSPRD